MCGEIATDESEFSSENNSDSDEKFLDVSNKSFTSIGTNESENTTHSYSNSLLEDEDDDSDDAPIRPVKEYSAPDLSDLNNGKLNTKTHI